MTVSSKHSDKHMNQVIVQPVFSSCQLPYESSTEMASERARAKASPVAVPAQQAKSTSLPIPFPDRTEQFGGRPVLLTCLNLRSRVLAAVEQDQAGGLKLDNPEPYFVTFFLVNILDGRRVSEDFHWNPNSPSSDRLAYSDLLQKLPWMDGTLDRSRVRAVTSTATSNGSVNIPSSRVTPQTTLSTRSLSECRSALFSIPDTFTSLNHIYLVVKVDKILSGSVASVAEKYTKALASQSSPEDGSVNFEDETASENKLITSYHRSMRSFCHFLSRYRMPFAWGARSLANCSRGIHLFRSDPSKNSESSLIQLVQNLARLVDPALSNSTGAQTNVTDRWGTLSIWGARDTTGMDVIERSLKTTTIPLSMEVAVSELLEPNSDMKMTLLSDLEVVTADLNPVKFRTNFNFAIPSSHPALRTSELVREVQHMWDSYATGPSSGSGDGPSGTMDDTGLLAALGHQSSHPHNSSSSFNPAVVFPIANRDSIMSSASVQSFDADSFSRGSRVNSLELPQFKSSAVSAQVVAKIPDPVPFTSFLNILYVSPRSLNLSVRHNFSRARNLSCFVELRCSDDLLTSSVLKVIHTRPSSWQQPLDTWSNTAVLYHESCPEFSDVIKLCLPLHLTNRCHLLFRFYHVSVDTALSLSSSRDRSGGKRALESSTGFAWLPIAGTDGSLNTGLFHLPVATSISRGYLGHSAAQSSGQTESSISWLENARPLFTVQLDSLSSIHTREPILSKFFTACGTYLGLLLNLPCPTSAVVSKSKSHRVTFSEKKSETPQPSRQPLDSIQPITSSSSYLSGVHLSNAIKSLLLIGQSTLIQFLPSVINQFMEIFLIGGAVGHRWTLGLSPEVNGQNSESLLWIHRFKTQQSNAPNEVLRSATSTLTMLISRLCSTPSPTIPSQPRTARDSPGRHPLLRAYVKYAFDTSSIVSACEIAYRRSTDAPPTTDTLLPIPLHHAIVRGLVLVLVDSSSSDLLLCHLLTNIWFPFALVIKSMTQSVHANNKIKGERSGSSRFPSSFSDDLALLIKLIGVRVSSSKTGLNTMKTWSQASSYTSSLDRDVSATSSLRSEPSGSSPQHSLRMQSKSGAARLTRTLPEDGPKTEAQLLAQAGHIASSGGYLDGTHVIAATARFIVHLFNLMDRGYVMKRVRDLLIFLEVGPHMTVEEIDRLNELRFQLLETLTQHELFVQLNLPCLPPRSGINKPVFDLRLTEQFQQQHFLVGIVLSSVSCLLAGCVDTGSWAARRKPNHLHRRPLILLRNLLAKHTLDPRYAGSRVCQGRIAALYLPLVTIVLAHHDACGAPGGRLQSGLLGSQISSEREPQQTKSSSTKSPTVKTTQNHSQPTSLKSQISSTSSTGSGGSMISHSTDRTASSRTSSAYLTKDGKVARHVLNQIAGGSLGLGARLQKRSEVVQAANRTLGLNGSSTGSQSPAQTGSTLTLTELDGFDGQTAAAVNNDLVHDAIEFDPVGEFSPILDPNWGDKLLASVGVLSGAPQNRPAPSLPSEVSMNGDTQLSISEHQHPVEPSKHQHRLPVECAVTGPRRLTDRCQRDLFVCFLHVLSTVTEEHLISLFLGFTATERIHFLNMLTFAIQHLRYRGKKCIEHYEHISRSSVGQTHLSSREQDKLGEKGYRNRTEFVVALEGNVATESGLVVLDLLHLYSSVFKSELESSHANSPLFHGILEVYISLLSNNPSDRLVQHSFAALRMFIKRHAKALFAESTDVLNGLCMMALRCANECIVHSKSSNATISDLVMSNQIEACGFLYRLWKLSYEAHGLTGFHRVHLQTIIAASKLVTEITPAFDSVLALLHQLVEWDMRSGSGGPFWISTSTQNSFLEACTDLIDRIRTVVTSTAEMRQHGNDPDRLVDLHYRLAKSYSSDPALRRTWLEELAKLHILRKNFAELAMTKIHVVALMAEYLKGRGEFPQGLIAFGSISSNVCREEVPLHGEAVSMEIPYTEHDLLTDIQEAAAAFEAAGYFEVILPIYALVIPVYEARQDYASLAQIYHHIGHVYEEITQAEWRRAHRLFGSYFYVTFYGPVFESPNGQSFIYRAPSCQQLNTICSELLELYGGKHGRQNVKLLTDSSKNASSLDPQISYIQVLHVEPYKVSPNGMSLTLFEQNYDVRQFMFDTPFVVAPDAPVPTDPLASGPKRSEDVASQWIRRTILTTDGSFPHLRCRLEVLNSAIIDFSPIDVAIDAMTTKIKEFRRYIRLTSIFSSSTGIRSNQVERVTVASAGIQSAVSGAKGSFRRNGVPLLMDMNLQGALLTTVNAGPMAFADVFLKHENQWRYPRDKVNKLRELFFEFLTVCLVSLDHYRKLMSDIHTAKYEAMCEALDRYRVDLSNLLKEEIIVDDKVPYIGPKSATIRRPSIPLL